MLIDTQALIWYAAGSPALSRQAAKTIRRGGHVYSHVTVWELATKSALQKVHLTLDGQPATARSFVLTVAARLQLSPLPLDFDDLAAVESLPRHHNDPFDRLLVTQSQRRQLPIVSADAIFDSYGISRVW